MNSSSRPRESDISRYRHGCDPPEHRAKVPSLSACKGRRPLTQFLIQLVPLQRILLALVFRFIQRKGKIKTKRCGIEPFRTGRCQFAAVRPEVLLSRFLDCINIQFFFDDAVRCHKFMTERPSSSVFRLLKCAITIGGLLPHERADRPRFPLEIIRFSFTTL